MNLLKRLFGRKKKLRCGGEHKCAVCDSLGREVGAIYYDMPDSDLKINYAWDSQYIMENHENMKRFAAATEKERYSMLHKILLDELYYPYSEKVFRRAEGFDCDGKKIEDIEKEKQFENLKKYYSNCLVEFALEVYQEDVHIKKKD